MENIVGIYRITNTITGDFYIGSSKNVKRRWKEHKLPSAWKKCPNNPMYNDMQKYGTYKFAFEILAEVEPEKLKETEQQFIETLNPTYNNYNAKGLNVERYKETNKEYEKTDKYKESQRKYKKSDKRKESNRKYRQSEKGKESQRKASNKYQNQLCCFNGQTLTLHALSTRFMRKGIDHPVIEAKKYLIER